ncbi:MAG: flavin reductase [Gammaproteobacteria bacterium]|nr:flavin reductase [Gammaproteobacteria bacterium]
MTVSLPDQWVSLSTDEPIWERFFSVFPLVLVGTREEDGGHDLAPKHMAMPMSWKNWFGFVCTPRHRTYHNVLRTGQFTVSYPRSEQIILASLAAAPRSDSNQKPSLMALPVFPAQAVEGVLVKDCDLYLECELDRMVDDLGDNSLIIGKVVAAYVNQQAMRGDDREDNEIIRDKPLFAYLYPERFAIIEKTQGFPMPAGFKR